MIKESDIGTIVISEKKFLRLVGVVTIKSLKNYEKP